MECSYDPDQKIWSGRRNALDYYAPDLSIGQIIFEEMRRHPQLIAQISETENTILTREELWKNSMRIACYLRNMGLEQSDIVGIIARNTTHIFSVAYACFFNGIPFHSLNINYEQETVDKLFNITKPKIIFCDGDEYDKVKGATEKLNVKIVTMRKHHENSIPIDELLLTPIEENFQPYPLEQGNNQTLAILCSSGTTGTPKAVTIPNSHSTLNFAFSINSAAVLYAHSTLDWMTGLLTTIISGVSSALRIINEEPFDPVTVMRLIRKHKVTWIMLVPTHMALLANRPEFEEDYLNSLRFVLYGGSVVSMEIQRAFRKRLSQDCIMFFGYGFTELCEIATGILHFEEKPNSVGRPVDVKLKILDQEGRTLGPNQVGEICVYSGKFWAGYYGNPEETRKLRDKNLWYHCGDLGYVDEDGFLFMVDRKKDMLKYQGIMYYPNQIEEVIQRMPEVSEVCVFGIWNALNGDSAAAAIVPKHGVKLDPEAVIKYVESNINTKYLHLHGGVFIVDHLKRTTNGKTERRATKKYCLELNTLGA